MTQIAFWEGVSVKAVSKSINLAKNNINKAISGFKEGSNYTKE